MRLWVQRATSATPFPTDWPDALRVPVAGEYLHLANTGTLYKVREVRWDSDGRNVAARLLVTEESP